MALIGKIRNNFWFVLLLLGLALAAFVIMDMMNAGNQGGLGPKQIIGEVAGEKIDYRDFQKAEQALYSGGTDTYAGRSSAWEYLKEKAIIDNQASNLGIDVSVDELMDLQFGSRLSPVIQSVYRNPQTGQVDMQSLLGVKQALENGDPLNRDFELRWEQLQKQIIKTAKQEKINALVSKSIFTPTFLAENTGKRTSTQATFDYVKVPFDNIEDDEVKVSDADIDTYIKENAFRYENDEETRTISYAVLDVIATSKDSANIKAELASRVATFKSKSNSTEDSLYTINNEGVYFPFHQKSDDLNGPLKDAVSTLNVGDVYGPYLDQGAYWITKLVDKAVLPDSVEASHILRSATTEESFAAAKTYIDSLRNLIETRKANFADMATEHSQDPGSKANGGDLGTFVQGTMVPPFNKAAFVGSREGGLYTVRTQFGYHLINVKKRIFENRDPKYKVAIIRSLIVPSEETQNAVYEDADEIVTANRSIEALKTTLDGKANISFETAAPVKANDYLFANLGGGETSREIVRWAFDADSNVGEVSPSIYTYTDQVNYYNNKYVLAGLKSVNSAGLPKGADMRSSLETLVMNQKKGEVIKGKVSGSDLGAIASSFGASVETAENVAFTAGGVTGLGNEPKVLAAAFGQGEGDVSAPIIGNNGVYIVKTRTKTEGTVPGNVIAQKSTMNSTNRSRVGFSLLNALKEKFKGTDNRSKFF